MQKTPDTGCLTVTLATPLPLPGLLEAALGPDGQNDPLLATDPPPHDPLDRQAVALADLVQGALAYARALDLAPVPRPHLSSADLRYIAGPLIIFEPTWGADIPDWLRDAIRPARLGLLLAGERELAAEEEAVAYLMTASLAQPLTHDWTRLYLWLGARVLARWSRLPDAASFWAAADMADRPELTRSQVDDLRRLRFWLRRRAATLRTSRR